MSQTLADRILSANKTLLQDGHSGAAAEFFDPGYVVHLTGQDRRGLQFVQAFVEGLHESFCDLRVEVQLLASEAERIAWQRTCRATHRAAFRGFPATGRTIQWRDMVVTRFEDGRIAEEWAVSDLAERLLAARR